MTVMGCIFSLVTHFNFIHLIGRFYMISRICLGLVVLCTLSACANLNSSSRLLSVIPDGEWRLLSITGEPVSADPALDMTVDGEKLYGYSGCNRYRGLQQTDQALSVGPLIATRMFCQKGADIETAYFAALEKTVKVELKAEQLTLLDADLRPLLVFVAK